MLASDMTGSGAEMVERCIVEGADSYILKPAALKELTAPLVAEGLLRGLRDPYFHERARPMPSVQSVHGYQVTWETCNP